MKLEDEKLVQLLIVDDHQIVIDGIKSMLQSQSKYVVVAEALTAEAAWEIIASGRLQIDILITDISMGNKNGIDLCLQVKTFNNEMKVMILSMYNDIEFVKRALDCEADGYVLKNSGQKEFIKALDIISENGAFYSYEIIPLLYKELNKAEIIPIKVLLTQREKEVLDLILQEMTSKEIAEKLFISKQTVDSHRINIMEKTACKSIVGLIKFAIRQGYLEIN